MEANHITIVPHSIRDLLAKGHLCRAAACLALLAGNKEGFRDSAILLSYQVHDFTRAMIDGKLSRQEIMQEGSQLASRLLQTLNMLEDQENENIPYQ